jgi:pimeloyl-ACP methyl ester carboxylesterase
MSDETPLDRLVGRFDPSIFDVGRQRARLRIEGAAGSDAREVLIEDGTATVTAPRRERPDAVLSADPDTWREIAEDLRGGMDAFRRGRLRIRQDLHLGVGFLAATAPADVEHRLSFRQVETAAGTISTTEAGAGEPVILLHGLGATKASFLPSIATLARTHRPIAIDLPGFGDSAKPVMGSYDAPFFARAVVALLDALGIERAHLVGNSMGGRVAIEVGLRSPERSGRLVLLSPSLAWLRSRPWAPVLRLVPTQLGVIQPAPRAIVEHIVRRAIPGSDNEWTAAGIDEFLRSYLTPQGRAAFYAAARNIYLEEPDQFWSRLRSLQPDALFVWGRHDSVVPIGFARHVREALPNAAHLELDSGHVPQLERPRETHQAMVEFLREGRLSG